MSCQRLLLWRVSWVTDSQRSSYFNPLLKIFMSWEIVLKYKIFAYLFKNISFKFTSAYQRNFMYLHRLKNMVLLTVLTMWFANVSSTASVTHYASGPQPPGHGPVPVTKVTSCCLHVRKFCSLFQFSVTANFKCKMLMDRQGTIQTFNNQWSWWHINS